MVRALTAMAMVLAVAGAVSAQETHNYVYQDGQRYSYELAVSELDQMQGRLAAELFTVLYLGTMDGVAQLVEVAGERYTVYECEIPCRYVKVMTFYQQEHLRTDYVKAAPGTVAYAAFEDVAAGALAPYVTTRNGEEVYSWVDEKDGIQRRPVPSE